LSYAPRQPIVPLNKQFDSQITRRRWIGSTLTNRASARCNTAQSGSMSARRILPLKMISSGNVILTSSPPCGGTVTIDPRWIQQHRPNAKCTSRAGCVVVPYTELPKPMQPPLASAQPERNRE